jgi:hypothetical protein
MHRKFAGSADNFIYLFVVYVTTLTVAQFITSNDRAINEQCINRKLWEELITYFLWYHMDRIENDVACVFVAEVTF